MKRMLVVLMLALPLAAADERAEKRLLLAELLETIDSRALVQSTVSQLLDTVYEADLSSPEHLDAEQRAQWEEMARAKRTEMDRFRDRLFSRIDYLRLADTVYTPMFDERFTAAELKALIAFAKTEHGQKLMQLIPELGLAAMRKGEEVIRQAADAVTEEEQKEEALKRPWMRTLADMRMIAVALEARSTDTEDYPKVSTIDDLEGLLSPMYIKTVPKVDSWGTPFFYVSDGTHYRLVSAGADKRHDWNARQLDLNAEPREMESLDADIIFQDGQFLQLPKEQ